MTPATQIDGLEIKLRQLAAKVDRQRAQHEAVVADNDKLQRELDRQLGVVSALKDKLERTSTPATAAAAATPATSTTGTPAGGDDNEAHRETIAFCLQEIDRCLAWLHRN